MNNDIVNAQIYNILPNYANLVDFPDNFSTL